MITKEQFWKVAGVKQHSEFESYLRKIVLNKAKREKFLKALLDIDCQIVQVDTFKRYFEDYSAERKANKQDYTPDEISRLLALLTNQVPPDKFKPQQEKPDPTAGKYTAADFTAGTGSLLIQKWWFDMTQTTPWNYHPHNYFYFAQEYADNVIPYLLLNLSLRGMNCVVVHGDTLTGEVKQVYLVENPDDNWLGFSDVNVMPHNESVKKEFGITKWLEKPIDHIESPVELKFDMLPDINIPIKGVDNKPKYLKPNYSNKPKEYVPESKKVLQVKDIASYERAKSKKSISRGHDSSSNKRDSRAVRKANIEW